MEWQKFLEDNIDYAGVSEAYKMAFKALDQEPCEDAISRQEVLYLIADDDLSMGQVVRGIHALPSITPQEPQSFKWCTDCKEYDLELHCCHRYSKVIRDTVAEIRQEPILDKLRAEVENINVWGMRYEPDTYLDQRPQIVQKVKDHVIEIIDKYKAEKEET